LCFLFVSSILTQRTGVKVISCAGLQLKHTKPYVTIKGQGVEHTWPVNLHSQNPVWKTLRVFGNEQGSIFYEINLFDFHADGIIGSATVTCTHHTGEIKTVAFSTRGTITIQCIREPEKKIKNLFFIRHGQSTWNYMQSHKNFIGLIMSNGDNPLSEDGIGQALFLDTKISMKNIKNDIDALALAGRRESKQPEPTAQEELFFEAANTGTIFVSPLTRAIQTAILGLRGVLLETEAMTKKSPARKFILSPSLREKKNPGGSNTTGVVFGSSIHDRVYELLSQSDILKAASVKFPRVVLDTELAEERWWERVAESEERVANRIEDFLMQAWESDSENIIFVGHSHYFRELCKGFYPGPHDCKTKIVINCGVVGITVDFSFEKSGDWVQSVETLFDSQFVSH